MWKIVCTLVSMVFFGAVTFFATILVLMELGTKFHGNYEYYSKYPFLVWGPAVSGFLAPGVFVAYLHKKENKSAWIIMATLAMMVVSGIFTYAILSLIFWTLSLNNFDPLVTWGLWGLSALCFLAPGIVVWHLQQKKATIGQSS